LAFLSAEEDFEYKEKIITAQEMNRHQEKNILNKKRKLFTKTEKSQHIIFSDSDSEKSGEKLEKKSEGKLEENSVGGLGENSGVKKEKQKNNQHTLNLVILRKRVKKNPQRKILLEL